jgi:type II secretory pathway component PulF
MTSAGQPVNRPDRELAQTVAWCFAAIVSFICVLSALLLPRAASIFRNLFDGLGVQLPLFTKFLLSNGVWLGPIFLTGIAIAIIVRQIVVADIRRRLVETAVAFVVAFGLVNLFVVTLYWPLFDLIHKLRSAR